MSTIHFKELSKIAELYSQHSERNHDMAYVGIDMKEDVERLLEEYYFEDDRAKEIHWLGRIKSGEIRLVSPKRKRKLWKKRGVVCYWSNELNSYYWFSEDMGDPKKNDIHRNSIKLKLNSVYGRAGNV